MKTITLPRSTKQTIKNALYLAMALLLANSTIAQDPFMPNYLDKIPAAYKTTPVYNTPALPASVYNTSEGTVSDSAFVANVIDELADTNTVETDDTLNMAMARNEIEADTMVTSYLRGIYSADYRYTAHKSGKKAVFIATLAGTPLLGIIPAIICSHKCPSARNLHIESAYINNPAYVKGYRYEARFIKQKAVWQNYVTGTIIWVGFAHFLL